MKKYHRALTAMVLAGATTLSLAHGDDPKTHMSAAVIKEQKEWGIAGDAKSVTRTVTLTMDDNMRFTPDKLDFRQGETVRFVIRNKGKLLHELVIGTKQELDEHAAMMLKFPAMQHDEPYMAHVGAGKRGGLIWTFNRPGEFDFACLIAGHYQAGMVGKISVAAASR
ncbi:cupredoxin family protein [Polaromonas sp.]|uniref:cupredoxin domain-containing protein n=1 Tax=Polaromonas sp. TaxID=1869339 RepID=UPI00248A0F5F|nr:cupredoxin family protein [Polaromonas sp.]MDI1274284.1 cupredoxin family protein [Polaromonas sp.]